MSLALCAHCGVVAPVHGASCSICRRSFDAARRSVAWTDDVVWVALRCTFLCRSCAFPSPLEGIELDQGVHCAQCGAFQRFDRTGWIAALAFAHEIGDLAGPMPEGRFPHPRIWIGDDNPHRMIGQTGTFADKDAGPIHVQAASGYPVCARCPALLDLHFEGARLTARCASCRDVNTYELPAEAMGYSSALRAVVAPEQQMERRFVRAQETQAGLVALLCPQCGAAVRPTDATTVTCAYCGTVAFLPSRMRSRSGGQIVQAPIFWVAMQGPSPEREALEQRRPKVDAGKKKALGILSRGFSPLLGIELADVKPGLDGRQLALTVGLTALALALGFGLFVLARL